MSTLRDTTEQNHRENELKDSRLFLEQRVSELTAEQDTLKAELLNEKSERKRTENELKLFQALLPQLPDGVIVTDLEGTVIRWMGNAESVFGYSAGEMIGKNISILFDASVNEHMLTDIRRIFAESGEFHGEIPCIKKDGTSILSETSMRPVYDENGKHILTIGNNRDVTKLKRVDKVIKDNELLYRDLIESQRDFIVRIDTTGMFTYVNELYCNKMNKNRSDLIQKEFIPFMVDDTGLIASKESARVWINYEISIPLLVVQYINTIDGWRWIAWKNFPIRDEQGTITEFQCVGHDITMLKMTEEKMLAYQKRLRFLTAEMSILEERQRRSIAQAIHDNVGQSLANCNYLLESLKISRSRKGLIPKILQVQSLISHIIKETRTLTFELSPPILYELGLGKAIRRLSEQILNEHNIQVYFEDDNLSDNLSGDMRGFLFQATRELLVNIVKHANAHKVSVSIRHKDAETQVRVKDDGTGFEMKETLADPEKYSCFGLFSISERIHYLGGSVDISAKPGHGTEITLCLPTNRTQLQEG